MLQIDPNGKNGGGSSNANDCLQCAACAITIDATASDATPMSGSVWTRREVEVIVDDYLGMLACDLAGVRYSKAAHRRGLLPQLNDRSEQSVEYKHANISAVLLELGFPCIPGYRPRFNYQRLLAEVVAEKVSESRRLHALAIADAERPVVVPEVDDILAIMTAAPVFSGNKSQINEPTIHPVRTINYVEREARNRSLGLAGEEFVMNFEQARLLKAGKESLAVRIEHTSVVRGDSEGYDILSFNIDGSERLIEVKTTKYVRETPFFISKNEMLLSERKASCYRLYRLFGFCNSLGMYQLKGAMKESCRLLPVTYMAMPR